MNIGIDARLVNQTGVGRYIRNLITNLAKIDSVNSYTLFLNPSEYKNFQLPNVRWRKILVFPHWHTMSEQIVLPFVYLTHRIDLLHVPYFTIPILYPGKIVTTVHDLTVLRVNTGKVTTLTPYYFTLKKIGLQVVLAIGLRKAKKIITVSQSVKNEILDKYPVVASNIVVTPEGVDPTIIRFAGLKQSPLIQKPYFLYVGNAYPHKNLDFLVKSFQLFLQKSRTNEILVFVGRKDFFYKRLTEFVTDVGIGENIIFFGESNDRDLANLYSYARALVFPSVSEGFGLPALEAFACGAPVLLSDIPVFHELLGNKAEYFSLNSPSELVRLFEKYSVQSKPGVSKFDRSTIPEKYNWKTLAELTLITYKQAAE